MRAEFRRPSSWLLIPGAALAFVMSVVFFTAAAQNRDVGSSAAALLLVNAPLVMAGLVLRRRGR